MFGKSMSNKYYKILILVGITTMVFGFIIFKRISVEGHNISMLKGMFQGAGASIAGIGIVKLIQNRITPEEKLKAKEIELYDERNIQVLRVASAVANTAAILLFAILAFIFMGMNYIVPAFISIGAMYIQLLTFFIAYRYYNNKM